MRTHVTYRYQEKQCYRRWTSIDKTEEGKLQDVIGIWIRSISKQSVERVRKLRVMQIHYEGSDST